jgi:hypothetical protein
MSQFPFDPRYHALRSPPATATPRTAATPAVRKHCVQYVGLTAFVFLFPVAVAATAWALHETHPTTDFNNLNKKYFNVATVAALVSFLASISSLALNEAARYSIVRWVSRRVIQGYGVKVGQWQAASNPSFHNLAATMLTINGGCSTIFFLLLVVYGATLSGIFVPVNGFNETMVSYETAPIHEILVQGRIPACYNPDFSFNFSCPAFTSIDSVSSAMNGAYAGGPGYYIAGMAQNGSTVVVTSNRIKEKMKQLYHGRLPSRPARLHACQSVLQTQVNCSIEIRPPTLYVALNQTTKYFGRCGAENGTDMGYGITAGTSWCDSQTNLAVQQIDLMLARDAAVAAGVGGDNSTAALILRCDITAIDTPHNITFSSANGSVTVGRPCGDPVVITGFNLGRSNSVLAYMWQNGGDIMGMLPRVLLSDLQATDIPKISSVIKAVFDAGVVVAVSMIDANNGTIVTSTASSNTGGTGGNDETFRLGRRQSQSDLPQLPSLYVTGTAVYETSAYVWGVGTAKLAWTIVATGIAVVAIIIGMLSIGPTLCYDPSNWSQTVHIASSSELQNSIPQSAGKLEEGWREETIWYGESQSGASLLLASHPVQPPRKDQLY